MLAKLGMLSNAGSLDFVGVKDKAVNTRGTETKIEEEGLREKVMGVVLIRGFSLCAGMYYGKLESVLVLTIGLN